MIARFLLALACLLAAVPALAKTDADAVSRHFRAGEAVQLRPDRAYLLLRMDTSVSKFSALVLRVPGAAEVAAFDAARRAAHARAGGKAGPIEAFSFDYEGPPNFLELTPKKPLLVVGKMATVLVEVMPGDYVFYGEGFAGFLYQCFCLGTVGFSAPAGKVTDMGTMLIDFAAKPSAIPELAGETNLGRSAAMDYNLFAVALRAPASADVVPPAIPAAAIEAAKFRAVGPYLETNTLLINRLAPMPGVLAYRSGRVIDVASGVEIAGQ